MKLLLTLVLALGLAVPVFAETLPTEYTVEMWNADPEDRSRKMVFSEDIVTVAEGATVTWLATDRGHNVEFVSGPEGFALPEKSRINDEIAITFDIPGVYVYVCTPHATMGMIGIVVVGEVTPEAIAAIADTRLRGASAKKFDVLLGQLQ